MKEETQDKKVNQVRKMQREIEATRVRKESKVHLVCHHVEVQDGGELLYERHQPCLSCRTCQHNLFKEDVDELTLVDLVVHLLHSVWVALNIAECVAGHWLTGGVETLLFLGYHSGRQGVDGQYVDGLSLTHGVPGSHLDICQWFLDWKSSQ